MAHLYTRIVAILLSIWLTFIAPAQAVEPTPSLSAAALSILRKGTVMLDAGQYTEALAVFQDYAGRYPDDPRGYFWIGVCFDEMGKLPEATRSYQDAVSRADKMAMDSSEIRTNLGNVYLKQNKVDEAVESYKRALEVNPQFHLARLNLGRALLAKNDFQNAISCFDKCDKYHFRSKQLPYYRAKALMGLGRKQEAQALVVRLLQELPEGKNKADIAEEFRSCLNPN